METQYNKCYCCGRIVRSYESYLAGYHEGYRSTNYKTLYPFEEKKYEYPEGSTWNLRICQDCLTSEGDLKIIKKCRIEAIEKRIESASFQENSDKRRMGQLRKRRKENKARVGKLLEYLKSIRDDKEPPYDWDELKIERDI